MSHEFPEEELLECSCCGMVLPYGMMTFLDDGRILCPDCYDEYEQSLEEEIERSNEEDSTTPDIASVSLLDYLNGETKKLSFIEQLPEKLKSEFISELNSGRDPFSDVDLMSLANEVKIKSFNCLDFETANECPSSVCSVGIVFVRDGKIVDSFYSLINPEPDYYQWFCQRVHGLGPADTDDAPCFKTVWNKVRSRLKQGGYPIIAHNAGFDEGCLKAAFQVYQMDYPDYQFLDTLKIARRHFGNTLPNHQLQTVAAACGYDLTNHHHALADAEACAAIALKIMPLTEILY